MISRSLSKRLERLETRSALTKKTLVINVRFIDQDRRVVNHLQLTSGTAEPFRWLKPPESMPNGALPIE